MTAAILLLAGIIAGAVFAFGNISAKDAPVITKASCGGSCSKTSSCGQAGCQASTTGSCGCSKTALSSINTDCPCGCNGSCGGNCGSPSCTCSK